MEALIEKSEQILRTIASRVSEVWVLRLLIAAMFAESAADKILNWPTSRATMCQAAAWL